MQFGAYMALRQRQIKCAGPISQGPIKMEYING